MPNPTKEQLAIIDAARLTNDHLLIDAKAGAGKTSTLRLILPDLSGNTMLAAFNKPIAKELEAKLSDLPLEMRLNISVGTVHSFGLTAYRQATKLGRKLKVDGRKTFQLFKDRYLKGLSYGSDEYQSTSKIGYPLRQLVGHAKNNGLGVSGQPAITDIDAWEQLIYHFGLERDIESLPCSQGEFIQMAITLLRLSNATSGIIDFDDMIYLPLLLNHALPQYNNVLIDEAQDISPTRRLLMFRSLAPGGRVIAVGDPNQAIYGFTGADAMAMNNIAAALETGFHGAKNPVQHLPLSICFRCDKAIIAEAQELVPGIRPLPSAAEGIVDSLTLEEDFSELVSAVGPGDAILCRLNRPNVSAALALLSEDIPARIEGRDIGLKLLSNVKKACPFHEQEPLGSLETPLIQWMEAEQHALISAERPTQAVLLADEVECAVLLINRCINEGKQNWKDLEALISQLFQSDIPASKFVTLSSVHKAKGREWPRVFILGRGDYMPFFMAEQDWELEQENNLIYVAITRAESHLTYVRGVKKVLDGRKELGA